MVKKFTAAALVMLLAVVLAFPTVLTASAAYAPQNVKQTEGTKYGFTITWDAIAGSYTNYIVERQNADGTWAKETTTSVAKAYISNVSAGKTYQVRVGVRPNYPSNSYSYSDPITVVTAPEAVENIALYNATTKSFSIKWKASAGATSYRIFQEVNGAKVNLGTSKTNKFTVKNVKNTKKFEGYVYVAPRRSCSTFTAEGAAYSSLSGYNVKLVPKKLTTPKTSIASYTVKVGCKEVLFAEGYQFQVTNAKGKAKNINRTTSYFYLSDLTQGQFYKVRARAYMKIGNKTKFGAWSATNYIARHPKMSGTARARYINATWSKVKGATSYAVYASTKRDSGYKKVGTTKGSKFTITKVGKSSVKPSKTYYFYVEADKKVGKKTYRGIDNTIMYVFTPSR